MLRDFWRDCQGWALRMVPDTLVKEEVLPLAGDQDTAGHTRCRSKMR